MISILLLAGGGAELIIADDVIEAHFNNFERSLFEIILLSCAKTLYSSGYSTFSQLPMIINNMPHISLYEAFSPAQQYQIYQQNLKAYTFHPAQEAFAYLHLWHLADLLNLSLKQQEIFIAKAASCEYEIITYKILHISTLLKMKQFEKAESLLSLICAQSKDTLFLKELTIYNKYHSFLYAFAIEEYFELPLNISPLKIPSITYFKYAIALNLLETQQIQHIKNHKKILRFLADSKAIKEFCLQANTQSVKELCTKLQSKNTYKTLRTLKRRKILSYIKKILSLRYWKKRFAGFKRSLAKRGLLISHFTK